MVAQHDVFVRFVSSGDATFNDPDRASRAVHVDLHVHSRWTSANAIRKPECALPRRRRNGSTERLEQRPRVAIRHRHHHDLRNRDRLAFRNPRRARYRRVAGRQRITGDAKVVCQRAALDMTFRTPRTEWKRLSLSESIFRRIGIDQQRFQPAALGGEGLEAAIAVRHGVAHERDLACEINAVRLEPVIVGRIAA